MSEKERSGLKAVDAVVLVGVGVVVGLLFFGVLHAIVNLVWFVVKIAVLVAIVGSVGWFLLHRRK